ncbi:hypothetical protein U8V72_14325 [Priestia filamentosa]|uniref:hypothetical protein n=1 Tax=Priestia filamentosa TaxID=1402861 RepID=UPI00397B0827
MRYFEIKFITNGDTMYQDICESNSKLTAVKAAMDICDKHLNLEDKEFEMKVKEVSKQS